MDPWQPHAVAGDFYFSTNFDLGIEIRMTNFIEVLLLLLQDFLLYLGCP